MEEQQQHNQNDINDNNNDELNENETNNDNTQIDEKEKDSVLKKSKDDVSDNGFDENDDDGSGFSLPDNIDWKSILMWGVVGFIFAFILVFLVSLISGTLAFVLGRLFLFGIIFFVAGAGIRLLLQMFAPEVFEEEGKEEDSYNNDDISDISKENNNMDMVGSNINTSIDDKIETDPLWSDEKKEDDKKTSKNLAENEKIKEKYGKDSDYIKVEGSDAVFPNNAELMAEGIRTMINKDDEN